MGFRLNPDGSMALKDGTQGEWHNTQTSPEYLAFIRGGGAPDPYVKPPPSSEDLRAETFRSDVGRSDLMTRIRTATPAQIDAFIDNNVTNIAQARAIFKAILKAIALDART